MKAFLTNMNFNTNDSWRYSYVISSSSLGNITFCP